MLQTKQYNNIICIIIYKRRKYTIRRYLLSAVHFIQQFRLKLNQTDIGVNTIVAHYFNMYNIILSIII